MPNLSGLSACGHVTFQVDVLKTYGTCHCQMCRSWSSGLWIGVVCDTVFAIQGKVKIWTSSRIAIRGF